MSASTQEERTEIEVRRMIAVPANLLTMEPCNTPNLLSSHLAPCWHPIGGEFGFCFQVDRRVEGTYSESRADGRKHVLQER